MRLGEAKSSITDRGETGEEDDDVEVQGEDDEEVELRRLSCPMRF
jgi:hypothetical protein